MKKSYFIPLFIILVALSSIVKAQAPAWLWAKAFGATNQDRCYSIAVDGAGNVYSTGYFWTTVDFDPDSTGVYNLTPFGSVDIFISKLDAAGNFVWAKQFGGLVGEEGRGIVLDKDENIYLTGNFQGVADFDPDTAVTYNLTAAGGEDMFVLKLNPSGNFKWAKQISGVDWEAGNAIAVDSNENVYTTGYIQGTTDFDPDSTATYNLTSAGSGDIFILKLDSMGTFAWARSIGGLSNETGISIKADNAGNVYATGSYTGGVDFDPGPGIYNLPGFGLSPQIFVLKLNTAGNFEWAHGLGYVGDYYGRAVALDASANVYVTGTFSDTIDFDPGAGVFNVPTAGAYDAFILKLDSSGNFIWARAVGGSTNDWSFSIATDAAGNVYTAGTFQQTSDFDPGPSTYNITSAGLWDVFVLKLDPSGNFVWAKSAGGTSKEDGRSIALNAAGNVYFGGYFDSHYVSFDMHTITNAVATAQTNDVFIAKLDAVTSTNEMYDNNKSVLLFPNPASGHLTIVFDGTGKKVKVCIIDPIGRIMYYTISTDVQKTEVNTESFAAGIYSVHLQAEGVSETRKFIVVK